MKWNSNTPPIRSETNVQKNKKRGQCNEREHLSYDDLKNHEANMCDRNMSNDCALKQSQK